MIAAGTEQVRQCELEKEMIEDAMNEIELGCVICWMKSEERNSHLEHGGKECEAQGLTITDEANETTIIDADTFRKQIKYAKASKTCKKMRHQPEDVQHKTRRKTEVSMAWNRDTSTDDGHSRSDRQKHHPTSWIRGEAGGGRGKRRVEGLCSVVWTGPR